MSFDHLVFPSAGSLSVAVVAAFILILQIWFSARRAEFRWYLWTAAISFSTILYACGILLEYNAPEGPINQFGGLLEWTAVIFFVHALYGFVFSRLNMPSRRYHLAAGGLHVLILILLWSTNIFVGDHFVARSVLTLEKPFVEPALGPLGPFFMLYALLASVNAIRIWILKGKEREMRSRAYVWGVSFWILLGAHDAAFAMGLPSFQYVMEYGFLGFSAALLYGMFSDYLHTADTLGQFNIILHKEIERRERVEEQLRETQAFLMSILDNSPSLIYANTPDNRYRLVNKAWERFMGKTQDEVHNRPIEEIFSADKAKKFIAVNQNVMEAGEPVVDEESVVSPEGKVFFHTVKFPLRNAAGHMEAVCGISTDISESKRAEAALRESEEKYRSLVESYEDSIYLVERDCRYLYMNKNHKQHLGLQNDNVVGKSYEEFHSKKETKEFTAALNSVVKTGRSHRYVHKSRRSGGHYLRTLSPVKDTEERINAVTVVSKDITEMIQAEEDLKKINEKLMREQRQRKILSKRLIDVLEKDRRQIAMELHDNIGQVLASLKIDIEMIHGKLKPEHGELGKRITEAQERTIQAIKDVKNISQSLRPGILDALGLVPSLRGLFNEIQRQTDIQIQFFNRNVPDRFSPEKELAIFRITQEAMTNIVKHARADKVFVNLIKKDNVISLSIEDEGIGFNQKRIMKTEGKDLPLGLLTMRERAEQLGGEFTLDSQAGKGTRVMVEIPV